MTHSDVFGRSPRPTATIIALLTAISALFLAGCGGGSDDAGSAATRFAQSYAGNWTGTWTDIDGTNGSATMAITADSVTHSATVTISLSGAKFGFVGSQTALTGSYDSTGFHVSGPTGQTAMATLVIDNSGQFTGTVTGISATIASITYGGPSTPQSVTLNIAVHHTDGTVETGTIVLNKQAT